MKIELNEEQERAIAGAASRVILAGPGSGKTATITEALARTVEGGTTANAIVAITFTNAAAAELTTRLQERLELETLKLRYCGTIHGYCIRELQRHRQHNIAILNEEESDEMLREVAERLRCKTGLPTIREAVAELLANDPQRIRGLAGLVAATYRREMLDSGLYSFDLVLHEGLRVIRAAQDPVALLLVDEVQDSAAIDFQIFSAIAATRRLYIGDRQQAIYGFRGGRATMDDIMDHNVVTLNRNHRSGVAICSAANALMGNGTAMKSVRGNPGAVVLTSYETDTDEALGIARRIRREVMERNVPVEEIAVLARTHRIVNGVAEQLTTLGIPVETMQPIMYPDDWEKAVATLSVFVNPESEYLCRQWLKVMYPEKASLIIREAILREENFMDSFALPDPGQQWDDILTGLARCAISIESIDLIRQTADELQDPSGATVLCALRQKQQTRPMGAGVACLTFHGAKGREWDNVYIAGLEQETIPGERKNVDEAEERRILFVGLTRARDSVTMSYCRARREQWGTRKMRPMAPSKFIDSMTNP